MNINTYSYRQIKINSINQPMYEYNIYSELMWATLIFDNATFRKYYSINQRKFLKKKFNLDISESKQNLDEQRNIHKDITISQYVRHLLMQYDELEDYLSKLHGINRLNDLFTYGNTLKAIGTTEKNGKITTYFTVEYEGNIYQIIKQAGHFLNIEKTNK